MIPLETSIPAPPPADGQDISALESLDRLLGSDGELDARRLAQAFALFSRASDELSQAYGALQAEVAQLSERFAVLMGALPAGVVVVDHEGRVEQVNHAAQCWLGGHVLGCAWEEVQAARLQPGDTPDEWEADVDGELRVLSLTETAFERNGGRLLLLHDVTEAQLMRRQAERNERLAAMGEMVAGLAHQLRTPLSAALLYAGNLARVELPVADRMRCVERIQERLRHLEKLIRDMLIFARGDSLGREAFAVDVLLAELGGTIDPLARQQGVAFRVEPVAQLAERSVMGNRKEIAGALLNLLENAVQATPAGASVSLAAVEQDGMVLFVVDDQGRGIPADVLNRLFTPFFTTRAEGTGLGLAIARGVARAHGGDIQVCSTPGQGSTFTMSLPLLSSGSAAGEVTI